MNSETVKRVGRGLLRLYLVLWAIWFVGFLYAAMSTWNAAPQATLSWGDLFQTGCLAHVAVASLGRACVGLAGIRSRSSPLARMNAVGLRGKGFVERTTRCGRGLARWAG